MPLGITGATRSEPMLSAMAVESDSSFRRDPSFRRDSSSSSCPLVHPAPVDRRSNRDASRSGLLDLAGAAVASPCLARSLTKLGSAESAIAEAARVNRDVGARRRSPSSCGRTPWFHGFRVMSEKLSDASDHDRLRTVRQAAEMRAG